jgi:capsular exopolysaccharide synthesis family protein
MGLGAGLIFGVALAFALEHLDDSINSKDDFERLGVDLPVLGIIPLTSGGRKGEPYVVARADSTSPAAEAYRTLRTSIQFAAVNRTLRTLQITSPSASEGKTTTAANLGVTFARANKKVVVVSCDLRRPRVHHFFGVSNNRGFTTVLLNEASPRAVLQPVRDEKGLYVVGSGPIPHNPSELLSSAKTAEVFSELASDAEMVIVDCPPVLPVTDAAVLASRMDATLLVVTMGSTTRTQLSRTLEILRQVKAPIIGAVLNGVTAESEYPEYYYRYEPSTNGNGTNGKKRERTADEVAREQY